METTATRTAGSSARGWPLERILFALAGALTVVSAVLAAAVSPWFLLITGFVGTNELIFASTGHCGASLILERGFGVKRQGAR